jgi:hypothetical protein
MLHFRGAFFQVQGTFFVLPSYFSDFTSKNFPGLLSSLVLMKIEGAKLVLTLLRYCSSILEIDKPFSRI